MRAIADAESVAEGDNFAGNDLDLSAVGEDDIATHYHSRGFKDIVGAITLLPERSRVAGQVGWIAQSSRPVAGTVITSHQELAVKISQGFREGWR